jgi:very-short-patch-repair endonuclease
VTLDALGATGRHPGAPRIRRVLDRRGPGPATDSLLETLFVQIARTVTSVGRPTRQLVITTEGGVFVARVDLCWPEIGLFVELDGQQHAGQPVYDARRETAVVATTGWLCGRFNWYEATRIPRATARRFDALADQARRRPIAA